MIGNILKELRNSHGYTQDYLSVILNVKRQTYSAYERNISLPDITNIKLICELYKISSDYLLGINTAQNTISDVKNSISSSEQLLINTFRNLNDIGKSKAVEYIEDLTANAKYSVDTDTIDTLSSLSDARASELIKDYKSNL